MATNFTRVNRGGQQVWLRKDKPDVYVTHYPALPGVRPGLFYVYRAVAPLKGRMPWTVDNRRISPMSGDRSSVHSLRAALEIAEAA